MELYFLRHGLAGKHGDPKYKDDSLRPLTGEGREKMRLAAEGMKALGLRFDLVLSSPYARARQTAQIVTDIYKIKEKNIHLTQRLLPPAAVESLLKEITTQFPKARNILLVGHEPHLTQLISSLLKSGPLPIELKKGGLCYMTVDGPAGQRRMSGMKTGRPEAVLHWLLTSTQLGLMRR